MTDDISRSITKTYRKTIWKKFLKSIGDYDLIKENDKIGVCISGGKDSFLLALLLRELQKHSKYNFDLKYIVMDPGYNKENLEQIIKNAKLLDLDITIFEATIFKEINNTKSPCYLCARKRRGHLYNEAQKLGCNKIALGHHFNDVIETIMLNILYNGTYGSMLPILKSDHYSNMELIRPLYLVKEVDIIRWVNYNKLQFLNCGCEVTSKRTSSKRYEVKELIRKLKSDFDDVDINIFNSSQNVNANTILGYKNNNKVNDIDND